LGQTLLAFSFSYYFVFPHKKGHCNYRNNPFAVTRSCRKKPLKHSGEPAGVILSAHSSAFLQLLTLLFFMKQNFTSKKSIELSGHKSPNRNTYCTFDKN
jgi:hypothetical protein